MTKVEVSINRAPVPREDLQWLARMGHALYVPEDCLNCSVLSVRRAAQARGVRTFQSAHPGPDYLQLTMVPVGEEGPVIDELDVRALNAGSGACRFAQAEPDCWRRTEAQPEQTEYAD